MDELIDKHLMHRKLEGNDFLYTLHYGREDSPHHTLTLEHKYEVPHETDADLKQHYKLGHDQALNLFKKKIKRILDESDTQLVEEGGQLVLKKK